MTPPKFLNNETFKDWLQGYLRENRRLIFGYENNYYWERYWIREAENEDGVQGLKVVFNIGSDSGYIPCEIYSEFVTWETFYELIRNKRFDDKGVELIDRIEAVVKKYKKL